jgi:hypothetical protein
MTKSANSNSVEVTPVELNKNPEDQAPVTINGIPIDLRIGMSELVTTRVEQRLAALRAEVSKVSPLISAASKDKAELAEKAAALGNDVVEKAAISNELQALIRAILLFDDKKSPTLGAKAFKVHLEKSVTKESVVMDKKSKTITYTESYGMRAPGRTYVDHSFEADRSVAWPAELVTLRKKLTIAVKLVDKLTGQRRELYRVIADVTQNGSSRATADLTAAILTGKVATGEQLVSALAGTDGNVKLLEVSDRG